MEKELIECEVLYSLHDDKVTRRTTINVDSRIKEFDKDYYFEIVDYIKQMVSKFENVQKHRITFIDAIPVTSMKEKDSFLEYLESEYTLYEKLLLDKINLPPHSAFVYAGARRALYSAIKIYKGSVDSE